MALGLLDRCCSAETMMRFPAIYKMSQNRSDFNIKVSFDLHRRTRSQTQAFAVPGLLDMVSQCSVSLDYSLLHVLCHASPWYVDILALVVFGSVPCVHTTLKATTRDIDCLLFRCCSL